MRIDAKRPQSQFIDFALVLLLTTPVFLGHESLVLQLLEHGENDLVLGDYLEDCRHFLASGFHRCSLRGVAKPDRDPVELGLEFHFNPRHKVRGRELLAEHGEEEVFPEL